MYIGPTGPYIQSLGIAIHTAASTMISRTVTVEIFRDGPICFIPVPFDPKAVFGKVRAPVKITLNGYSYRSTIAAMGGTVCIPLRKSNREAAGLAGGETLSVMIELDTELREVQVPPDLEQALQTNERARRAWQSLSYSHKREHVEAVESAKKAETRVRRLELVVQSLASLK